MTKYLIVAIISLICGILIGWLLGIREMKMRAADGICVRTNGEAYLKISEAGQQKIMDPTTRLLCIQVVDVSTRNKHPL